MHFKHNLSPLFILILLFSPSIIYAGDIQDKIEVLKKRKLIVVLMDVEDESERSYVEYFNESFKEVVNSSYTFHDNIYFKTFSEMQEIKASGSEEYAVLEFIVTGFKEKKSYHHVEWEKDKPQNIYEDNSASMLGIGLIEENSNLWPYLSFTFCPSHYPNNADLIASILFISEDLKYKESGISTFKAMAKEIKDNNEKFVKNKTLLLNKFDFNFLEESDIQRSYPYKYKFVDYATIEEALINKQDDFLIVFTYPGYGNHEYWILECGSGKRYGTIQWPSSQLKKLRKISEKQLFHRLTLPARSANK